MYIRILLFYILGTFVIGLLVPSNSVQLELSGTGSQAGTAAASPFVIAIETAGIKALPSVSVHCLCIETTLICVLDRSSTRVF